jgi:hypothetical protein
MDVLPLLSVHDILESHRRDGLVIQLEGGGVESLPSINGEEIQVFECKPSGPPCS